MQSAEPSLAVVPGVEVRHLTVAEGEVQTGVTVIRPYPSSVLRRKLFIAAASEGVDWTGAHVAGDFGTFSSPIVVCNATTIGLAYDALITHGLARDADLPIDDGWPPIVIGLDDGYLDDLRTRRVTHDDVLALLATQPVFGGAGCIGVGRGLCAFDGKGGVGEAAFGGDGFRVGAWIAANGGGTRVTSAAPGFVLVVATDLPLLPRGLRALAEAGLRGLDRILAGPGDGERLALAFSTANTLDGTLADDFGLLSADVAGDRTLASAREIAAATARAALRRALEAAHAVTGRRGRTLEPVDVPALFAAEGAR